jgi:hypothetical protein
VPGPISVKVVLSMVKGFIASLKVAVTMVLGQISDAPTGGATEITVGPGGGAVHGATAVVKVHT